MTFKLRFSDKKGQSHRPRGDHSRKEASDPGNCKQASVAGSQQASDGK